MARRRGRAAAIDDVPGYRDIAEIGSGAFATVYGATEIDTGRRVALKALKANTIHPRLVDTFNREIQALARVSDHPNIVTLYRPLTAPDGRLVLVLELCRESLAQRLRRGGSLGARDVTRIGVKVAGALETAHRAGFLHRDMKPQNIMVTQFGEPALGDFGVAALQASAQATVGVLGFTTLHAAPEMLEGHHLSPATDVYGLASTMYQALTGLAPFATFENEAPASVILRIIRDPVRPIRSPDIPIDLSDLLEAALAKDPTGRPETAAAFAEALIAVEVANGWPATTYVAWGDSPPGPRPAAPATEDPATTAPAPPAPAPRPDLQQRAPSVHVADVAHARPQVEPVAEGAAATGSGGGGPTPPAVVAPAEVRTGAPGGRGWTPPPPPPPRRLGPGVADPGQVSRHVVAPGPTGRGQQGRPMPDGGRPLPPLNLPAGGPDRHPAPPEFVDPPGGAGPAGAPDPAGPHARAAAGTHREEALPGPGRGRSYQRRPESPVATAGSERARLAWMALIGLAALVVLAAILLVLGVL